jgi:hypothetical protein
VSKFPRPLRFALILGFLAALFAAAIPRAMRGADEWLPISPEDLALKDNPKSPGADAMILYRESVLSAKYERSQGDSDTEYYRIKIFTDKGKDYASVKVPYYSGDIDEERTSAETGSGWQIIGVRGRTIQPDGSITKFDGKVLDQQIEREGGIKIRAAAFSLPNVQPGSIIEYKYTKQAEPYWLHSEEWTVSDEMFTREAHFTFVPLLADTGYIPMYRVHGLAGASAPKCDVGVDHSCIMVAHDVPAVVDEELMPPKHSVESNVEWFYALVGSAATETPEHFWNRMGKKWNTDLDRFVDKKKVLDQDLSQTVSPGDSAETKLRKIYARVQKIRNLNLEDSKSAAELKAENVKKPLNAEDVIQKGYGTARDINFLFVGLARAAGLEATELYIAPRNIELFIPQTENESQLSADIVWVRADSKEYYLDPSARFYPFGLIPWFETQTSGIKLSKNGGEVIETRAAFADGTLVRHADLTLDSAAGITGTLQIDFTGEFGALRRTQWRREDEVARKKGLEEEIKRWLPSDASFELTNIQDWNDISKPLRVEGTLKISSLGATVAHRVLVPADLFPASYSRVFSPEKRINAIFFPFPYEETDDLTFRAPKGFTVEALPDAKKIDVGAAKYNLSATQENGVVEVKRHLVFSGVTYAQAAYAALRAFYGTVKSYDSTQVVFQSSPAAQGN